MATFNELVSRSNEITNQQVIKGISKSFIGNLFKDILLFFQNGFSGSAVNIQAKYDNGRLFVKHGNLPDNVDIVLLRKKRRGSLAGSGRPSRTIKNAWCWGWNIKLSKGTPNKWYIPNIIEFEHDTSGRPAIGQPIDTWLKNQIFVQKPDKKWRYRGVYGHFHYAKFAFATSIYTEKYNINADDVAVFKFRVIHSKGDYVKTFSVE